MPRSSEDFIDRLREILKDINTLRPCDQQPILEDLREEIDEALEEADERCEDEVHEDPHGT